MHDCTIGNRWKNGPGTREQKLESRVTPSERRALLFNRGVRFFYFFYFHLYFQVVHERKKESEEGTKKQKKKIEGATRGRINNAAREERGGLAELYVSKAASRVMTRRPIHVRYLGHTWILIHAAIAAAVD